MGGHKKQEMRYPQRSVGEVLICLSEAVEPVGEYATESVTQDRRNVRPVVYNPGIIYYSDLRLPSQPKSDVVALERYCFFQFQPALNLAIKGTSCEAADGNLS